MENLLFALCRFREATGRYPDRVTVVSFAFKRHRFLTLHRAALRFPRAAFRFVGVDPPRVALSTLKAEVEYSVKPFELDPYGCADSVLREKRSRRDPFRRGVPYVASCPELRGLLRYCGRERYRPPLPWSATSGDDLDGAAAAGRRA